MAKDKKDTKHYVSAGSVRKLTGEEVGLEITRLRGELHNLRQQRVTGKIDDHSGFKKTKRSIARILTERGTRRRAATAKAGK